LKLLILHFLVMFVWGFVQRDLSGSQLTIGFILGFVLVEFYGFFSGNRGYVKRWWLVVLFFLSFFKALIIANLQVVWAVLFPRKIRAGFAIYHLSLKKEAEITALANSITLTPGTLTVDVSKDRRKLFIHSLFCHDCNDIRRSIRRDLEEPLARVCQ